MLWRIAAALGGTGGLVSLALPYAVVSGSALGLTVSEESYTLLGLARLLVDAGEDPQLIYVLVVVIVVGSTLAVAGAALTHWLALAGGVVQGVAAAAFAYGATTQGSQTFLAGLGQVDVALAVGPFVLAAAAVVSLVGALLGTISSATSSPRPVT